MNKKDIIPPNTLYIEFPLFTYNLGFESNISIILKNFIDDRINAFKFD